MFRRLLITSIATGCLYTAAGAQTNSQSFNRLVDDSVGYLSLAPGQVMLEAEDGSSHFCRVSLSDDFFDSHAAGQQSDAAAREVVCVPIEASAAFDTDPPPDTGADAFARIVDESIGYLNIAPGIVLIEGETVGTNRYCRVRIPDAYFDAFRDGDSLGFATHAPEIVCAPL